MKHSRLLTGIVCLVVIHCMVTAGLVGYLWSKQASDHCDTQYVLYIGTNDKDSYTQEIPTEEAVSTVRAICFEYVDGFTVQLAEGAWKDENGNTTDEKTIICYLDGTDAATVHSIADAVIRALNQNTVLIEKHEVAMEYYSGASEPQTDE